MNLHLYVDYGPLLLRGLFFTLAVSFGALLIGLLWGLLLCLLGQLNNPLSRALYQLYITLFRGTPLLVQIYLVFYGGPFVGIELSALQVGVVGLGMYSAAYFAEIYRSGFLSIARGQIEAARDLGFSRWQILTQVKLPQMLGLILPAVVNQTILLVKESAILSVITVPEMLSAASRMSTETFSFIEPYLFLGLSYWLITFALARAARLLERRTSRYSARP
ncbi:polar amino acid transport system permease protein [Pseudomonas cuatrocienegasensis]|uniref:Polar amino acid transport system permease protein n=1 Tax=Pseudomonas cuatrocienegasensis TaxID=543360 RepID=A0ABY1BEU3_9PSED|nr:MULTISPECIES: amino acid ABC transporter permease [Pseudomonas]OEC34022.1 polar amino acid ABC transporter permease [Pseudomonas sp. 21C1]SEQ67205.1 polar amino acid transport system permease protein [Pseudomonas cuatrocienegasensis]